MHEINILLIFNLFQLKVFEISKKYGMGQVYIQGQVEEARHQLQLQLKKFIRS